MDIITQFPHQITEDPDMGIPMPDGTRLSARVWMPDDAHDAPVPAILEYIPYRKRDGTIGRDALMHPYFAGRGYAVIRLDMRGSGDSEGVLHDEYTPQELQDGVEAIAWIAAQDWCDGNVGMMGKSWGGFNCLQVAALQPPALKAIITVCSTTDRFGDDIHYKGGCLLNDNLAWASVMLSYSSRPPDPMLVGDKWKDMWLERLETQPFLLSEWLPHQTRDAYWKHGSVCEDYSAINAAVLSFGGWADNYMNTVSHLVSNLSAPVKGIVGPWVHQYPHSADPAPQIGFVQEALRWWDHWLKGANTGVQDDPAMRLYLQDSVVPKRARKFRPGHWLAEKSWPSDRVSDQVIVLSPGGRLGGDGGALNVAVNSPLDTGFGTGSYFPMSGDLPEMPGDQRVDDARSACFDGDVLDAPLDIVGAPKIRVRLSSDKPAAQLIVRLCDVDSNGASTRITYGVLNLAQRDGHEATKPLEPGEVYDVTLTLDQIAYHLLPGRRLRVAVSSVYWPFLWPAPERATLTLHDGALTLPVHEGSSQDEWRFEPPESSSPWNAETIREPSYAKSLTEDWVTGEICMSVDDDHGARRDGEHGLASGSWTREDWRIHPDDPLCASGQIKWRQELSRGDWAVRTETSSAMWSDATHFHFTARLEAYEGDEMIFSRDFTDSVKRDCC